MATELKAVIACVLLLETCGCIGPRGYLYTHTKVPYALPREPSLSRVGAKSCRVDITKLKEPFTQASFSVRWTNRAVADAMKRANMTEIRYADVQTLSILNGIYERRRLIFYGE